MDQSSVDRVRRLAGSPANRCFACGPGNHNGLKLIFETDDTWVRARWQAEAWCGGWHGVVHGGLLSAVLDEAMAYTLFFRAREAVTARMELRYRSPARIGETLDIEARLLRETRGIADVEGRVRRGGETLVEATGRFVVRGALNDLTVLGHSEGVEE